jgi:hypothetical protein
MNHHLRDDQTCEMASTRSCEDSERVTTQGESWADSRLHVSAQTKVEYYETMTTTLILDSQIIKAIYSELAFYSFNGRHPSLSDRNHEQL